MKSPSATIHLAFHRRHLGKLGQCRIHMIPGLGAGCEDVQGRFIEARVVEAPRRDHREIRHSAGLSEQTRTAFRTKATAERITAVRFLVVVLDRARNLQRRGRQSDVGFVRAAGRLLAIAAVAIPHEKRIGRTLVAHPPAKTASGKFSRHSFSPASAEFLAALLPLIGRESDGIVAKPTFSLSFRETLRNEADRWTSDQTRSRSRSGCHHPTDSVSFKDLNPSTLLRAGSAHGSISLTICRSVLPLILSSAERVSKN